MNRPVHIQKKRREVQITQLREHIVRLEKKLAAMDACLRSIADSTQNSETWQSPDGTYLFVAPPLENITEYPKEAFFCNPHLLEAIAHPDDRPVIGNYLRNLPRNNRRKRIVFRMYTRSRDLRWISHYCTPVFDTDGAFLGRRSSVRDITAQKQLEEDLEARIAELQETVNRIKPIKGVLPVCSFCKKIRDKEGNWHRFEKYLDEHSAVQFSHGMCPDCLKEQYPEFHLS